MARELPVFIPTTLEDVDQNPCKSCPLNKPTSKCFASEPIYYHAVGTPADPSSVDLLVLTDPPSLADVSKNKFFSDNEAHRVLQLIKETGVESFIIAPAIRCHPMGQIDHFVLTKKYKNKKGQNQYRHRTTPLENAKAAVENCKVYTDRLRAATKNNLTLAMGPLALEVLGQPGNTANLRSSPFIPKGIAAATGAVEGTIVTYDRAFGMVNRWAMASIDRDIKKVKSLRETGYATPRGNEKTISITTFDTVDLVKRFVDKVLTSDFAEGTFVSVDFETTDKVYVKEKSRLLNVGFSFTNDEDSAFVIPLYHPETPFSADELIEVMGHLRRLFQSKGAKFYAWLAHNAQFETEMIKLHFGVWWGQAGGIPIFDTMIMAYCLDEDRREDVGNKGAFGLAGISRDYLGWMWYNRTAAKSKRKNLEAEPLTAVNLYVGYDAVAAARLLNEILERMIEEGSAGDLLKLLRFL
jgi:uracil-DNA glycosylase